MQGLSAQNSGFNSEKNTALGSGRARKDGKGRVFLRSPVSCDGDHRAGALLSVQSVQAEVRSDWRGPRKA